MPDTASYALSLMVAELQKDFPHLQIESYFDSYENKQKVVKQIFDLDFYNHLI
jgi:hypothetical protein